MTDHIAQLTRELFGPAGPDPGDPRNGTLPPAPGGPAPGPGPRNPRPPGGTTGLPRGTVESLESAVWQINEHFAAVRDRVTEWKACDWHVIDRVVLSATPQIDGYNTRGNPVLVLGRKPTRRMTIYNPTDAPVFVGSPGSALTSPVIVIPPQISLTMPWNADDIEIGCAAAAVAGGDLTPVLVVRSDRETDEIRAYPIGGPGGLLQNNTTELDEVQRTADTFKSASMGTGSTTQAVWTPATGKRFRLMGFTLTATADVAGATNELLVSLKDGGTTEFRFALFVPTTSVTTTPGTVPIANVVLPGNGFLAAAANDVLNLTLSAALTAGAIQANAFGTEE